MVDSAVEVDAERETVTVRILGDIGVVRAGGGDLQLPSASQRRLVAVLALDPGRALRRDHLCDLLEITPGALRTTVSRLRARLGPAVISTDVLGYRLTAPVDATMFVDHIRRPTGRRDRLEVLDDALGLWHGEALDEFSHEHWAEAEVTRLDELRSLAVEERAELCIDRRRAAEAVASLLPHIAANPLRDRPRGLLIRALAAEGRQADALRAFQDYRSFLAEETGTEPSAEVRSLEHRVATGSFGGPRGAPGVRVAAPRGSGRGSRSPGQDRALSIPVPAPLVHTAALLGRRREWAPIAEELEASRSGSSRTVLVGGEAGIGKTTLLAEFARAHHARGGVCVLYGRCHEGAMVPLEPFREAIGPVVEHAPDAVLRAHGQQCGGELLPVAPRLARRMWLPRPLDGGGPERRHVLFEAVADLLGRVADAVPVILVLDDLHWAEPSTLRLVRHLSRSLVDVPLLLVASFRAPVAEGSVELRSTLAELDRSGARRVPLDGLEGSELAELVTSVAGRLPMPGATLLERLWHETAGNPLFATHLVRWWADAGVLVDRDGELELADSRGHQEVPPGLRDLLWSRVRSLGGSCHAVLGVASVLGVDFDEDVLVEVAELGASEVSAALDLALGAGLVHDAADGSSTMRFAHALVARSLYAELRGARRRALHRRAAEAFHARCSRMGSRRDGPGGRLSPPLLAQLARHSALAGDLPAALRFASAAGDFAARLHAPAEAAAWYQRALDHAAALQRPDTEQADLMACLGAAMVDAGNPEAEVVLGAATNLARGYDPSGGARLQSRPGGDAVP
jgi:DNA-binding SARP family transcriptional activator